MPKVFTIVTRWWPILIMAPYLAPCLWVPVRWILREPRQQTITGPIRMLMSW